MDPNLPEGLREFVNQQVENGTFADPDTALQFLPSIQEEILKAYQEAEQGQFTGRDIPQIIREEKARKRAIAAST